MMTRTVREGDKGRAWHPDLQKLVEVVYQTRTFFLCSENVEVCTLVGVHLPTDTILTMPHQSAPDVVRAINSQQSSTIILAHSSIPVHP